MRLTTSPRRSRADQGQEDVVDNLEEGGLGRRCAADEQLMAEEIDGKRGDPPGELVEVDLTPLGGALQDGHHRIGADL
jgi:hypothetical protein